MSNGKPVSFILYLTIPANQCYTGSMKYHIFIGSTLDDLKNERKELIRIVMELGHIPVLADYLDSSASNSAKLLQKIIEDCDYFIALVAHKYKATGGNLLPLIAESLVAAQKGIPVLGLVIDEKARWKPAKKEKSTSYIGKLNDFKAKLKTGPCVTWTNTPDLCQKAQTLLLQEFNIDLRPGWVSSDRTIEPKVANELSRLSAENSALRRQYSNEDKEIDAKLAEKLKHTLKLLALNKVSLSFYYASGDNWENTREFRLLRIYKLLVPELTLGKSTAEISHFLGMVLNPNLDKPIRKEFPTPSNTIKKIMADLSVLGLVCCINDGEVKAGDEIWDITGYGKELYSAYRLRQLEKVLAKKSDAP